MEIQQAKKRNDRKFKRKQIKSSGEKPQPRLRSSEGGRLRESMKQAVEQQLPSPTL